MARIFDNQRKQIFTGDTPDYVGNFEYAIEPEIPEGVSLRFLKTVPGVRAVKNQSLSTGIIEVMSPEEIDAIKAVELDEAKTAKIAEIDAKTSSMITAGYTFKGKVFDTDPVTQFNWKNMFDLTNARIMPLPVRSCTKYDEPFEFTSQADINAFYLGGTVYIAGLLESGRQIKYQVRAATTVEEVNAIIDPR